LLHADETHFKATTLIFPSSVWKCTRIGSLLNLRVSVGAALSQRVVYSRRYKEAVCHCDPCFRLVMICSVNNSTRCVCFGQPVSAVILEYGNLKLVLVSSDPLVTRAALRISIISDTLKYR
jgi:hypothetical protein